MQSLKENINSIDKYYRAVNYLTVAQLFLKDNILLDRKLDFNDLKSIALGHWGTCPGVNFLYTHFNYYLNLTKSSYHLILGSGHAAPALLSNLYLDGTLGYIYPDLCRGSQGMEKLITGFGNDPRLQTEISAALPGVIYVGGELGSALACAIGSVLNDSRKTSFCIVGDGEIEAGSTIPSLFGKDFLIPGIDGFLILAVNLNQYKMGSRSLLSTWSDRRIKSFFRSFGFTPLICDTSHKKGYRVFSTVAEMYRDWVKGLTSNLPVIILNNKKGETGPDKINGNKFVGCHYSHKVSALKYPNLSLANLRIIESWLKSYRPEELFNKDAYPRKSVLKNIISGKLKSTNSHKQVKPNILKKTIKKSAVPVGFETSPTKVIAKMINNIRLKNKDYLVFSPDEAESNGLEAIINKGGLRSGVNYSSSVPLRKKGAMIEILNENSCHGMLQGYNQTGRDGVYVTYEAFAPITASQISQYYKFLRISNEYEWRASVPSLKYILSSLGWRNCYTHQNPDFLNTLLSKSGRLIDVYFPNDPNQVLACFFAMTLKNNVIQVMITGKTVFKTLRSFNQACGDINKGYWIREYGKKSSSIRKNIVVIGDYMMRETMIACEDIIKNNNSIYIKIISLVHSKVFERKKMNEIFGKNFGPHKVIVICTGYVNIFRGLFSKFFDIQDWKFRGYNDGFSSTKQMSVLEVNHVSQSDLKELIVS